MSVYYVHTCWVIYFLFRLWSWKLASASTSVIWPRLTFKNTKVSWNRERVIDRHWCWFHLFHKISAAPRCWMTRRSWQQTIDRNNMVSSAPVSYITSEDNSFSVRYQCCYAVILITGCAVLMATHHSYGSLAWLSDFFDLGSRGQTPQPILTQNGSNDVHSRKDVPFAVKSQLFIPPDLQGP